MYRVMITGYAGYKDFDKKNDMREWLMHQLINNDVVNVKIVRGKK